MLFEDTAAPHRSEDAADFAEPDAAARQALSTRVMTRSLRERQHWLHPILSSLFPPLLLYSVNVTAYDLQVLWRPCLVSAALAAALWTLLSLVMADPRKVSFVVTATVLACYSFGPVHTLAGSGSVLLFAAYGIVFALILRASKHLDAWTRIVNITSLALVALPISNILMSARPAAELQLPQVELPIVHGEQPLPDIYFVILDGYGRSDVLRDLYDYDNSAFVEQLRQRGFYIAENAHSNYPQTKLSLASTLNLEHLDTLLAGLDHSNLDHRVSRRLIRDNRLARLLKQRGYSIVEVQSPLYDAEFGDPDLSFRKWWFLNLFEITAADMTPLPWLLEKAGLPGLHALHRQRMAYSFQAVDEILQVEGPKFAFIHIFAGHPPFVVGEQGEPRNPPRRYSWKGGIDYLSLPGATKDEYRSAYKAQLEYVSHQTIPMIDKIVANSRVSPVIVVQGDHGPASNLNQYDASATDTVECFDILNAIRMGDAGNDSLYSSISSVNTFRVISNAHLGTNFELLSDRSYFSLWTRPFEFIAVGPDGAEAASR